MNRYSFTYDMITEDYFAVEAKNVREAKKEFEKFIKEEYQGFFSHTKTDGRPRFHKIVEIGTE